LVSVGSSEPETGKKGKKEIRVRSAFGFVAAFEFVGEREAFFSRRKGVTSQVDAEQMGHICKGGIDQ